MPKTATKKKRMIVKPIKEMSANLPDLIDKFAEVKDRKNKFLAEIKVEEEKLKRLITSVFDANEGMRSAESDKNICSRVKGERLSLTKDSVTQIYGLQAFTEMEADLRKAGCVSEFDYLRISKKKVKGEGK